MRDLFPSTVVCSDSFSSRSNGLQYSGIQKCLRIQNKNGVYLKGANMDMDFHKRWQSMGASEDGKFPLLPGESWRAET